MTKVLVGTNDWSPVMKAHAAVADGSVGIFSANTAGPMAGTSWFRKLFLGRGDSATTAKPICSIQTIGG